MKRFDVDKSCLFVRRRPASRIMLGRRSSFLRALSSRLTLPHMSDTWSHRLRLVFPHLVLLVATLSYAVAGAFVFISIEGPYEIENRNNHLRNIRDLQCTQEETFELVRLAKLFILENVHPPVTDRTKNMLEAWLAPSVRTHATYNTYPGHDIAGQIKKSFRSLLHLEADKLDNTTLESIIDDLIFVSFVAFDAGIRLSDFDENVTLKWSLPSAIFFTTTVLTSIGEALTLTQVLSEHKCAKRGILTFVTYAEEEYGDRASVFVDIKSCKSRDCQFAGYGHLVPISPLGRLFCIGYAFLGIPLTLITIADVAKFLSDLATSAYRNPLNEEVSGRTRLCIVAILLFYMTIAALIFSVFETAWSFLDSFYFCLITVADSTMIIAVNMGLSALNCHLICLILVSISHSDR
uniref:Ion_trans_2 domain-containing protein n=1 Tax=Ascaris lumbricoides TaxID=6252 RepID=A0A0M3I1D3_ASCLU